MLRLIKKNFEDEQLPHELFLTTRQTTEIRNTFANNLSTDVELSKADFKHNSTRWIFWFLLN